MISIYNKISDYIMVLNSVGDIIFCNESFLNKLNYEYNEILNLNITKIIKDKYNHSASHIIKECKEINETIEFYTKSGQTIKINSNISIENFNNEKSILIIGKEVDSKAYTTEMLEDLLDNIDSCTFILKEDGKYLYVNKAFTNILNKTREEIIGTYNEEHWEYDIYTEFDRNNKEVVRNKSPKIFNEKLVEGEHIQWYESYKAPIFDKGGNHKYVVATSKNVTLSKTISEELYKNYNKTNLENRFYIGNKEDIDLKKKLTNIGEQILEYTQANSMSVLLYDREKNVLVPTIKLRDANKYFENIERVPFPIKVEELANYKCCINSVFPLDKIDKFSSINLNHCEEVAYSGNYLIELYNEFIGFICISFKKGNAPKFNSDEYMKYICNKIAMIIKNTMLANEVSIENKKRKYTEEELERYLNVSTDLVAIVGKDGYLKKVSPNWYNVLGWTEEELLSIPVTDIVHPEELDYFIERSKHGYIEAKITRTTIRYRHKNGDYISLEWSSEYIDSEEVFVTSARDITKNLEIEKEKRNLEEAMHQEIVKNEFFSNISHEFRTPINIILGTMQVINKNIENNNIELDSLKKYTNYIKQNSYRLLRLVNNLIDISKMDIGMYELRCSNQNIISIIEDITLSVADYTVNNNINLIFDTDEEEVITYCDPDKIERIILNLLSNAIKYTPEDGNIKVKIKSDKNQVTVSVKDSGVGIPKDKLDVIFDRFGQVDDSFNRKCEGSGIGLSLVKNLVEMHRGTITVNSKVNKGSEFIFSIPIEQKEEIYSKEYDNDRKFKHVERCDIEFSDIYSV